MTDDVHIAHVQLRSCQLAQVLRSACARRTVLRERGVEVCEDAALERGEK
jgi:hypothetical protein